MSLKISDERHPAIDARCWEARMIISAIPTQEQVIAWLEDLRAHPDREIGTDTGTITARTLLERYVEPGAFEHMGPGNIRWALRRQGWVL